MFDRRRRRLTLLGCLVVIQTVSGVIQEGDNLYTVQGDKVTIPCAQRTKPGRPITKVYGSWIWQSPSGARQTIVSYSYSNREYKGVAPMKERSRVVGQTHEGNYTLAIDKVSKGDEGRIECDFTHEREKASNSVRLHVLQASSNAQRPVLAGDKVSLSCSTPVGSVSWLGPKATKRSGQSVDLGPVRDLGQQMWTCTNTHRKGSLQAHLDFEVVGFLSSSQETLYVAAHSAVTLPCVLNRLPVVGGLNLGWFRNGTALLTTNRSGIWSWVPGQGRPTLEVSRSRPAAGQNLSVLLRVEGVGDAGDYVCRLTLGDRSIQRSIRVHVVEVTSSPPGDVLQGTAVTLTCRVSPGSPVTRMVWQRDTGNVAEFGGTGTITRAFHKVNKSQEGVWYCLLYHGERVVANSSYWLNVTDVSGRFFAMEKNFIVIVGLVAGSVLVLVLVLVTVTCLARRSRRRRQAVRRLRHPLCREHSNQLSNQPLCQGNDYIDPNRPLPRPPQWRCPHNPPRKGRSSRSHPRRSASKAAYTA